MVGIGFGLMLSPLSTAALNAVYRDRAGLASSVANTTRQTGNVIGIALLGALVQTRAVAAASASLRALPAPVAGPLAGLLGHGRTAGAAAGDTARRLLRRPAAPDRGVRLHRRDPRIVRDRRDRAAGRRGRHGGGLPAGAFRPGYVP